MSSTPFSSANRLLAVDALRGAACIWMAVYHFCFDLRVFGWQPDWNFYSDPFWTSQRTAILSTFLLCAGLGQGIATARGQSWQRFWRRWLEVAAGAALVSLSTYWAFGERFVWFGVLHGIALMLIVTRLLTSRLLDSSLYRSAVPGVLALVGFAILAVHGLYQRQLAAGLMPPPAWDTRWLNWLGLVSHKPATEDFVPLIPWLAVMLVGAALGLVLVRARAAKPPAAAAEAGAPARLAQPRVQSRVQSRSTALRVLVWLGQRSLLFYLLHQPVFWGLLYAAAALGWRPSVSA